MQNYIFEAALGLTAPWFIQGADFDAARKTFVIQITFVWAADSPIPACQAFTSFTILNSNSTGI